MSPRSQPDLFNDVIPSASESLPIVAVPRGPAPLTKEQKAFNRLAGRVGRLREELRAWQDFGLRYNQRLVDEVEPVEAAVREAQCRMAFRLDVLLQPSTPGSRLRRAQRDAVRQLVASLANEILQAGPDVAIEALHDRYAETSHAELARAEFELAEAMLGELLGDDTVAGHAARSVDELPLHAQERMAAKEQDAAQRKAERAQRSGNGPSKAQQAAERKAQARVEALGSVRAIYRKLASAVHPDRAADASTRAHRTVLMQRANEAYERNDVLTLLALQMELEQIDTEHLATAPPQRLNHFIAIMKEQAAALEDELEVCVLPYRLLLDSPRGKLSQPMVERELDDRLQSMRGVVRAIEADLLRLDDPVQRREFLADLTDVEDPFAQLEALMRESFAAGPPRAPRTKARKARARGRRKR